MKKSKIYLFSGIGAAILLAAGAGIYAYRAQDSAETETVYKETKVERGTLTVGVTESGSVSIGSLTQDMDFIVSTSQTAGAQSASTSQSSGSSAALEVEEVYVTMGQEVSEGDPLLKLTEESIEKYRKELTDAVTEASAKLSEASLASKKEKVSAGYSYDLSIAKGSVAQEEYNATIAKLKEAVDEAQEAVDESQALMNYYQEMIDSGMDLSESLASEQENYNKLYNQLKSAQSAYTTQSIEAEKTY